MSVANRLGSAIDFHAVDMGINRVIEVLPQALEECQRRFMNPFQRWSFMKVWFCYWQHGGNDHSVIGSIPLKTDPSRSQQESKYAKGCAEDFRNVCREMLVNMRQRLLDSAKDVNIGFQLHQHRRPTDRCDCF